MLQDSSLPTVVVVKWLSWLSASDVMAFRESSRLLPDSEVPRLCANMSAYFEATLRATLKHRGLSLPGASTLADTFGLPLAAESTKVSFATTKKKKKSMILSQKTDDVDSPAGEIRRAASSALWTLRVAELRAIYEGLESATIVGRGYLLSKNWQNQARRYCEAKRCKLLTDVVSSRVRGRSRSGSSETLPPWPDANADLLCDHGFLAPRSLPRAKRVLVDRVCWRAIIRRFPLSTKLKASSAADCRSCRAIIDDRQLRKEAERLQLTAEKQRRLSELEFESPQLREATQRELFTSPEDEEGKKQNNREDDLRRVLPVSGEKTLSFSPASSSVAQIPEEEDEEEEERSSLSRLLRRLASKDRGKKGVPHECLSSVALSALESGLNGLVPLTEGRYHLLPRTWLQRWRASLRSAAAPRPGLPPTCDLLCLPHGRPLVSPNLRAFLQGDRSAFAPQHETSSEILTAQEWRALNTLFPVDFAVTFDVVKATKHHLTLKWLTEPCNLCDPSGNTFHLHYRQRTQTKNKNKRQQKTPTKKKQQQHTNKYHDDVLSSSGGPQQR